jgi:hypothetical protein
VKIFFITGCFTKLYLICYSHATCGRNSDNVAGFVGCFDKILHSAPTWSTATHSGWYQHGTRGGWCSRFQDATILPFWRYRQHGQPHGDHWRTYVSLQTLFISQQIKRAKVTVTFAHFRFSLITFYMFLQQSKLDFVSKASSFFVCCNNTESIITLNRK